MVFLTKKSWECCEEIENIDEKWKRSTIKALSNIVEIKKNIFG